MFLTVMEDPSAEDDGNRDVSQKINFQLKDQLILEI